MVYNNNHLVVWVRFLKSPDKTKDSSVLPCSHVQKNTINWVTVRADCGGQQLGLCSSRGLVWVLGLTQEQQDNNVRLNGV